MLIFFSRLRRLRGYAPPPHSPHRKSTSDFLYTPIFFAAYGGEFCPTNPFTMLFFSSFFVAAPQAKILSFSKLCERFPLSFGPPKQVFLHWYVKKNCNITLYHQLFASSYFLLLLLPPPSSSSSVVYDSNTDSVSSMLIALETLSVSDIDSDSETLVVFSVTTPTSVDN